MFQFLFYVDYHLRLKYAAAVHGIFTFYKVSLKVDFLSTVRQVGYLRELYTPVSVFRWVVTERNFLVHTLPVLIKVL